MLLLAQLIAARCFAGERVALCTLVKARGSTPQETGAKMAVTRDGMLHGTLGGGCVEAEVRRRAVEFLHLGRSELLTFRLDHDYGWDDGLICGGTMLVQVQVLEGAARLRASRRFLKIYKRAGQSNFNLTIKRTKVCKRTMSDSNRGRRSSSLAAGMWGNPSRESPMSSSSKLRSSTTAPSTPRRNVFRLPLSASRVTSRRNSARSTPIT